ncbi:MAG: 2'-5' RNA ligase family protein [Marmoricola sp.]
MRLVVAIVPPFEVRHELDRVVGAVTPGSTTRATDGSTGRRSSTATAGQHAARRRRLFGRGRDQEPFASELASSPPHDELARTPVDAMYVPIATIGQLTLGDSIALRSALRTSATTWERPTLGFTGGTALEWPSDRSVWARLDGDLDRLQTVGKGVPEVVKRLALFVDRRQFRPWLSVGTITEQTTAPYLEDLVGALERFQGSSWTQESFSLLKALPDVGSGSQYEVLEELPLAAG